MSRLRATFLALAVAAGLAIAPRPAFAGAAGQDVPTPVAPPSTGSAVVVGSYGGYWGLNDHFMGLLSQYFTLAQMKEIDRQIQAIAGITDLAYNYNGESGSGYRYNPASGSWSSGGSRVGKHYDSLVEKAFWIDVETASVVKVSTAQEFAPGNRYGQYFASASLVGNNVDIEGTSYHILGARNWSPIVLDLQGDGIIDTNRHEWLPHAPRFYAERTTWFDLTGDRAPDYCEWLGSRDGLLVKPEADGTIKGAENLFGTAGGYNDGYEKLSVVCDSDQNGQVEGIELDGLYVWIDANTNGRLEAGELQDVRRIGVERISTHNKNFVSEFVRNGKRYMTWDWWPSGFEMADLNAR